MKAWRVLLRAAPERLGALVQKGLITQAQFEGNRDELLKRL